MIDGDFIVFITRLLLLGMIVADAGILFAVIMGLGVIDNLWRAFRKSKDDSLDENTKKSSVRLNIISAVVLMIPIVLIVIWFWIA